MLGKASLCYLSLAIPDVLPFDPLRCGSLEDKARAKAMVAVGNVVRYQIWAEVSESRSFLPSILVKRSDETS